MITTEAGTIGAKAATYIPSLVRWMSNGESRTDADVRGWLQAKTGSPVCASIALGLAEQEGVIVASKSRKSWRLAK